MTFRRLILYFLKKDYLNHGGADGCKKTEEKGNEKKTEKSERWSTRSHCRTGAWGLHHNY